RDHRMTEPPTEVHGHEGDDLHGLARPGGLFDQHVFGGPTDVGHQAHLVWPQSLDARLHTGQFPWRPLLAIEGLYKVTVPTRAVSRYSLRPLDPKILGVG